MQNDGLGEGILGVGVDVHLHDAIGNGFADVGEFRAGATVEYEGHAGNFTVLGCYCILTIAEDGGFELDVTGLVNAVYVAEGGSEHEFAERSECFIGLKHVFGRGVKLVSRVAGVIDSVFFTANDTNFYFEDDAEFGAFLDEFLGELEVFIHREGGGVKHVGVEEGRKTLRDAAAGFGKERADEGVHMFRLAVVGVQANEYVVFFCEAVGCFSKDDGTDGGTSYGRAGGKFAAADGNLDDTVGFCFGESAQSAVDDFDRRYVDGRKGVAVLLCRHEHFRILFWGGDRHNATMLVDFSVTASPKSRCNKVNREVFFRSFDAVCFLRVF